MDFQVTPLAGEAISEMSSDMIKKSVTEQPVLTIYFKGTTVSIWGTGGSEKIPAYLKLTVDVVALENLEKEDEKFTHQGDYQDLPIFTQDLAINYLADPTVIDAKKFFHFSEFFISNAPILIENTFWKVEEC